MLSNEITFSISSPLITTGSLSGMNAFDASPLHLLHLKSVSGFRRPLMFEQRLCTQKPQAWHLIELIQKPLLHTPLGNLLPSTGLGALWTLTKIFVLPTFKRRPLDSRLAFQTLNYSNHSRNVSAMITRSST